MKLIVTVIVLASLCATQVNAKALISDRQIGKILAEVHCGKRSMNSALNYLNHMGVERHQLENMSTATRNGYRNNKSC